LPTATSAAASAAALPVPPFKIAKGLKDKTYQKARIQRQILKELFFW